MASLIELAQTDPQKARKRLLQIRKDEYLQGFIKGAVTLVSDKDVIVEFGANVGVFTNELGHSGAKVLAYEADPLAAEQLKTNMAGRDNIEVFDVAVGATEGKLPIFRSPDFDSDNLETTAETTLLDRSEKGFQAADEVEIKNAIEIIENAIKEYGEIAILSLDINGSELEILEEMCQKELFDNIRLTIVKTYQKYRRDKGDVYRELRMRAEVRPEWAIKFNKA